jgi:hypothetical protein
VDMPLVEAHVYMCLRERGACNACQVHEARVVVYMA